MLTEKKHHQCIDLDEYKLSWIGIDQLDNSILTKMTNNFNKLWNYHPKNEGSIIIHGKDIPAHRYMQSYMNTPKTSDVDLSCSSYMFSTDNKSIVPKEFYEILEFINIKFGYNYNQIVVNWYEPEHFLPLHRDWSKNHEDPFYVTTVTLCQGEPRTMTFNPSKLDFSEVPENNFSVKTTNGLILTIGGMTNSYYKHGINKENNATKCGKRISVTLRHF